MNQDERDGIGAMLFGSVLVLLLMALLGLLGCKPDPKPSPSPTPGPTPTPLPGWDCTQPEPRGLLVTKGIAGKYTVRLRTRLAKSSDEVRGLAAQHAGVKVLRTHRKGFEAQMTAAAAQRVADDPEVQFVHPSVPVRASVTWGLDRIDGRTIVLDGKYEPFGTGAGVSVAVIDTGIDASHPDFEGRVAPECFSAHGSCPDGNGHGTHVAGTVGSRTWGVAKQVRLFNARVLDSQGSGTDADVIAGIDWVTQRALADPTKDWVANMSLGGDASPALDAAVCDSIEAGVTHVVAAGNDFGADACDSSPARVAQAITVGASDRRDVVADFSNLGKCLDLFSPGVQIESARRGGGSTILSGTSMASPHVAGGAALWLEKEPGSPPSAVRANLVQFATRDALQGVRDSINALLFVGKP